MPIRPRFPTSGQVDALLFDAGDVLYDATPGRRRLLRVLAGMGLHTQYACFYRIWERNFLRDVHRGASDYGSAFRAFLTSFGFDRPQIDEIERATNVPRHELETPSRLLPAVRETLVRPELAKTSLAVLTNSTQSAQSLETRLANFGLAGRFQFVFSSIDLGCALPDRAAYHAAAKQMGVAPNRVAFVGHNGDELAGAALAGMPTIAINYEPDAIADVYLEQFQQLVGIVSPRSPLRLAG